MEGCVLICENCFWSNHDLYGNELRDVNISLCVTVKYSFKKWLSSFPKNCTRAEVTICDDCHNTFKFDEEQGGNHCCYKWEDCWPSFMWHMFTDASNQQFGVEMWMYIPLMLWLAWL